MTEWNPASIAAEIRHVSDRLEKGAEVIRDAHDEYLTKKRAYTLALAEKKQEFFLQDPKSTATDRTDRALPFCMDLWEAQDTAEVAYKHAMKLAEALEKKLSGLQTEAKLIMQAYNTAGVGER